MKNIGNDKCTGLSFKVSLLFPILIFTICFWGAFLTDVYAQKKQTIKRVYSSNMVQAKDGTWIRYIGLSSPGRGREYYEMCRDANKALVQDREIRIEFDVLKEKSGMTLAYVYVDDLFINAEMVRQGYALVYEEEPNTKYSKILFQMQKEARENRRGLWAMEDHGSEPYYIGSKERKEFHRPGCSSARRIPFDERIIFRTQDEALEEGFRQHWRCCPLFFEQEKNDQQK